MNTSIQANFLWPIHFLNECRAFYQWMVYIPSTLSFNFFPSSTLAAASYWCLPEGSEYPSAELAMVVDSSTGPWSYSNSQSALVNTLKPDSSLTSNWFDKSSLHSSSFKHSVWRSDFMDPAHEKPTCTAAQCFALLPSFHKTQLQSPTNIQPLLQSPAQHISLLSSVMWQSALPWCWPTIKQVKDANRRERKHIMVQTLFLAPQVL